MPKGSRQGLAKLDKVRDFNLKVLSIRVDLAATKVYLKMAEIELKRKGKRLC